MVSLPDIDNLVRMRLDSARGFTTRDGTASMAHRQI